MPQTSFSYQTTFAAGSNLNKIFDEIERRNRLTAKAGEVNANTLQKEYDKTHAKEFLGGKSDALAPTSLANRELKKISDMKGIMTQMLNANSIDELRTFENKLIQVLNSLIVRGQEPNPKWGINRKEFDLIASNVRVFVSAAHKEVSERMDKKQKEEKFNNSFVGKVVNGLSNKEKFDRAKEEHKKNSKWGKFVSKLSGKQVTSEIENEETQIRR